MPRAIALVLAVGLAGTTSGCGRYDQARQCHDLASLVNEAFDDVNELSPSAPPPSARPPGSKAPVKGSARKIPDTPSVEALRKIAYRYDALVKQLGPLEFRKKELAVGVAELARHLTAVAENARKAADAAVEEDRSAYEKARRELVSLNRQVRSSQANIQRMCR